MITPDEIVAKAQRAYSRFLAAWIRGEDAEFFPYRMRAKLTPIPGDVPGTIAAVEQLSAKSKQQRGWGYTIHRKQVRSRDFGSNRFPEAITIDTVEDLLRLAGRVEGFAATEMVAKRIRGAFPGLSDWVAARVRSLADLAPSIEGLIAVTDFFLNNPWPDCYARQIPVAVDTKFVDRHQSVLRQWLDQLLPASAIDVNETQFARRFGLRDRQPHRGVRVLDADLLPELGLVHDDLSLPLRSIAELPVRDTTVVIVENNLNLLTLPPMHRGIGLAGEGKAVTRLEKLTWLHNNRIIYWGEIDVDGFLILSSLRSLFPHAESIMMDRPTFEALNEFVADGNGTAPLTPTNLNDEESATFTWCANQNLRLEQEKVPQRYVDDAFATSQLESKSVSA